MAAEAGVPVIPMVLWGTQRMMTKDHPRDFSRHQRVSITVGEPMQVSPDEDATEATAQLRTTMAGMLDRTISAYPEQAGRRLVAARVVRRQRADPRGGRPPRRRGTPRTGPRASATRVIHGRFGHRYPDEGLDRGAAGGTKNL